VQEITGTKKAAYAAFFVPAVFCFKLVLVHQQIFYAFLQVSQRIL